MPSKMLIWPTGMEAECDAYIDWASVTVMSPPVPPARFYEVRFEREGRRVCSYLGPGGIHGYTEEPEGGEALREGAILQWGVEWPDDPEGV